MPLMTKCLALVEIVLRVPPLFVVDELLKFSLGLPMSSVEHEPIIFSNSTQDEGVDISDALFYDANFLKGLLFTIFKFSLCCFGEYILYFSMIICVTITHSHTFDKSTLFYSIINGEN